VAITRERHERRGAEGAEWGGASPVGKGSGKGALGGSAPSQKIFVILHFKWCIFVQFGVYFTLKGV